MQQTHHFPVYQYTLSHNLFNMLIEDFIDIRNASRLDFTKLSHSSISFKLCDVLSHYLWLKDRQPPASRTVVKSTVLFNQVADFLISLYEERGIPTIQKGSIVGLVIKALC